MNRFRKLGFIEYNGRVRVHKSLLNVILHDQLPEQNAVSASLLENSKEWIKTDQAQKLQLCSKLNSMKIERRGTLHQSRPTLVRAAGRSSLSHYRERHPD
jgi:hypothetical protein